MSTVEAFLARALARAQALGRTPRFHLLFLTLLVFVLYVERVAIDVGMHWDEHIIIQATQRQLANGLFLSQRYNYPGVSFTLPFIQLLPDIVAHVLAGTPLAEAKRALSQHAGTLEFTLATRTLFMLIAESALVWLYLFVLRRRSPWEALCAAALLGLSFEVSYHARWIAPDALVMSFAALTLFALGRAESARRPWPWQKLAAVAAGLATGSKYPGGIMLAPVLVAPLLLGGPASLVTRTVQVARLAALFALTYLLTTPATLIEPYAFVEQLLAVKKTYQEEGHGGYTIEAGAEHLGAMGVYLSLVALSHYPVLAGLLTVAALAGAAALVREDRRWAVLLLAPPLIYLLYFSSARVMIVRNLLVVFPFFALLAARGLFASAAALRRLGLGPGLAALPAALLVLVTTTANARFMARAARSIVTKHQVNHVAGLARFLDDSEERFTLSPKIGRDLAAHDPQRRHGERPARVTAETPLVVYAREIPNYLWKLPANRRGRYRVLPGGPWDVTWDYYPSWMDENRILIMSVRTATSAGLPLALVRSSTAALPRAPIKLRALEPALPR